MRRKQLMVAGIVIAVIVVIGAFVAITVFGNNQKPTTYVAQVYVTSWNSNTTTMNLMDVQFKISMDLNNDGVYEVQQSSAVLNQTYIEVGVFHLGGPIASDADHFRFKIEAFKIDNGTSIPLIYTADGSIPVNQGSSEEGALNSWSYDATLNSSSDLACNINYMYFIS